LVTYTEILLRCLTLTKKLWTNFQPK
jgi:hypothetical protein